MSLYMRIINSVLGFVAMLVGIVLFGYSSTSYSIAAVVLSMLLIIGGLQKFVYYFTMARFMVGGFMIFLDGFIRTMIAVTLLLTTVTFSGIYVFIVLQSWILLSLVKDTLAALEAKAAGNRLWFLRLVPVALIIYCIFGLAVGFGWEDYIGMLFSIYIFVYGVNRIISALRKYSSFAIDN